MRENKKLRIIHKNTGESEGSKDRKSTNPDELLSGLFDSVSKIKPAESPVASNPFTNQPDYEDIVVDDVTQEKINQLQKITFELEKKELDISLPATLDASLQVDYLKELNKNQCIAAINTEGPCLVIAGAGSGKTRVIVYRVSYLLETGADPGQILLLTFTRKAAREMLNRVEKLLHNKSSLKIPGGTFHAFANYTLRRFANMLGLSPSFTIIDSEDSADAIDLIKTELKYNKQYQKFPKKQRLQEIISASRNRMMPVAEVIEREFSGLEDFVQEIETIKQGYQRYKTLSNVMDYDDLMELLLHHLKANPVFLRRLQDMYRYILVDEFQDTNVVQKEIVTLLAHKHQNIMAVGDDSQSIYAFRGANYENILRFHETFPNAFIVKIEQNYRSNQGILDFTNAIISKATLGYRKKLYSDNQTHWKPVIRQFYSQIEEAEFIVDRVLELREKGIPLEQQAVLFRAMWHSNFIQTELLKRNIPYVVVGGLKFTERRHIKDLIAFLRVLQNPSDAVAWHRILKLLPGIGKISAGKILKDIRIRDGKISFEEFSNRKFFDELEKLATALNKAKEEEKNLSTKINQIKNYYAPILETLEYDFAVRMNDIQVFIELAEKYQDLEQFLSDFALDPPANRFQDKGTPLIDEEEDKPLVLSTVHSAKGLEWYAVFIPFALDGLFPSIRAFKHIEQLEEERRLFYVACSRAKEQLYITMPSYVASYNAFFSFPSRFITEIDENLYIT